MIILIAEFIEALNDVESFDLIKSLIDLFSSSISTLDRNSWVVSNSNNIELYTISACFLFSKSMQILLSIWFKGVEKSVEI